MPDPPISAVARRRFLGLLAGSSLGLLPGVSYAWLERAFAAGGEGGSDALARLTQDVGLIGAPELALDVLDFEPVARQALPPAHFGYLATGVDDDATLRANRDGFDRYSIRVRRLIDVSRVDMSIRLFDRVWDSPIVIAPAGSQKAFHPEGEIATARAAKSKNHLQILSTVSTSSVEDVNAARGEPVWYQLYPTDVWPVTKGLVKRAEAAGCPVLALTVDLQGGSNRLTLERAKRVDSRQCVVCHQPGMEAYARRRPMFDGLDVSAVQNLSPMHITWEFIKRLRDTTSMRLVVKGIVTREDAELAVEHGVDGLIVSNHGGRGESSGRATIECLPEVVEGVAGRVPVLVDGGFRRGTDIFKALALGATAVCVGRPYLWGLAGFGQPGVETVLDILRRELTMVMRQAGTTSIDRIAKTSIVRG